MALGQGNSIAILTAILRLSQMIQKKNRRPIHTPDPYQNAGDPDRSVRPDHQGIPRVHNPILMQQIEILGRWTSN